VGRSENLQEKGLAQVAGKMQMGNLAMKHYVPMKFFLWFVVVMKVAVSFAQDTDPDAIFKRVAAAYRTMETFSTEGTVIYDAGLGSVVKLEEPFSLKFKKPNLYLISYRQTPEFQEYHPLVAIWNDGTQPYIYWGIFHIYSRMANDAKALSAAEKVLGAIPMRLFFPALLKDQANPLSRFAGVKITGTAQVEGENCFLISGSSAVSVNETIWISKNDYTIRKYCRFLESPADKPKPRKLNEQRLKAALKRACKAVTQENMDALAKMIWQHDLERYYETEPNGASTEIYRNIGSPKLSPRDFDFRVPAGATVSAYPFKDP